MPHGSRRATGAPAPRGRGQLGCGTDRAHIRGFTARDLPHAADLAATVSHHDGWPLPPDHATVEHATTWLQARPTSSRHVAVLCNRVVGYAITYPVAPDDPSAHGWQHATGLPCGRLVGLGALLVHPDARRQGIATALTRRRIDHAARTGAVPVLATLHPDDGFPSVYAALGGRRAGDTTTADGRPVALWAWPDDPAAPR